MSKKIRIAVGGYCHETNRFGLVPVTLEVLLRSGCEKERYFKVNRGIKSYCGGFIDEAEALGVELVPAVQYTMKPSGPATREAMQWGRDYLSELLAEEYKEKPYDAIALFLHGAGAAEGCDDVEGEILNAIRQKLGQKIPIGVALDLHGNISEEMMQQADLLVGCKNYPHTDEYETGRLVLRTLHKMVTENFRPCKYMVHLPWHMVPAQGTTTSGPAGDVRQRCIDAEKADPQLLHASFFQGFPYADVPMAGVSVVTMAKNPESARQNALAIARYAWSRRKDFAVPLHTAREAVELALQRESFPVLINESADNPGGGAPGDGTFLLRALLEEDVSAAFGFIYDPLVAAQAAEAGVGARISCSLGGKTDARSGEPIELKDAYVKSISDGRFIRKSPMAKGAVTYLGTTVCLEVGNVSIIVAGFREQTFDDGPFVVAGVDWQTKKIVALKSSQHFRGWWGDKVETIISCDPPGTQSADLKTFDFQHADTTYYPLQNAEFKE